MLFQQGNHYTSSAIIYNYQKNLTNISFTYQATKDSEITIPLINYPGYVATNHEGKRLQIKEGYNHMIVIPLAKGIGTINVYYKGVLLFKLSDYISLSALLVYIYNILQIQKLKNWHKLL